ncbi:MAG: RsmB/NOP family class I SAM-dependent RNA methyltransferase [Bacteroidetes bacterium]|nr:RsmB/NOP family class I SAM-dependent RNA methyltransferase [Bacteroidota bacterium]
MSPSSLAGHVIELIDEILKSKLPADRVIADFYKERRYLGSHDRRWITEKVYSILRNYILLRELVGTCAPRKDSLYAFLIYEFLLAKMQPDELEGGYSKLMETYRLAGNEIDLLKLSDCSEKKLEEIGNTDEGIFILNSFPHFFGELLPASVQPDALPIMIALNHEARVCVRVDTNKISRADVIADLQRQGVEAAASEFSPMGIYLPKRVNLNNVPLYKDGVIDIQEEASQIVGLVLDPKDGETIVDACAGAGGKSLELAALSGGRTHIYALDVNQNRLETLAERAGKSGFENIRIIKVLPDGLEGVEDLVGTADKVVVDAPCTGSGTIRRNPDKKFRLTKSLVQTRAAYQKDILQRYAKLVKVGGYLYYVTCSIFAEENQSVIEWFVKSNPQYQVVDISQNLPDPRFADLIENGFLAIYPHRHEMDGFFAAAMKRLS